MVTDVGNVVGNLLHFKKIVVINEMPLAGKVSQVLPS